MLSAVDMTFTRKNVLRAVWEVENDEGLGDLLGVPESKRYEIQRQFSSDPQKKKKAYINYVMDHDPAASWRSVIVALDVMEEKEAADKIRGLAEPVTGKSLSHTPIMKKLLHPYTHTLSFSLCLTHTHTHTHSITHSFSPSSSDPTLNLHNLCLVMTSVKDWDRLGGYHSGLGVPPSVCLEIYRSTDYKTEEEKKAALLQYFLDNVPMASWQTVAGALHYRSEEEALQMVQAFLPPSGESVSLGMCCHY